MSDLKFCPACGGDAKEEQGNGLIIICCRSCEFGVLKNSTDWETLRKRWNTRPHITALNERIARLEAWLQDEQDQHKNRACKIDEAEYWIMYSYETNHLGGFKKETGSTVVSDLKAWINSNRNHVISNVIKL